MPFAQNVHATAPPLEYVPTAHAEQDHLPVLPWYLPDGQSVHVFAPEDEYLPATQVEQEVAPLEEYFPRGQEAHDPLVT